MLIDCDTCRAPASACADCVMTVLLQRPPQPVELDDSERAALGSLAAAGLVPPLRLVVGVSVDIDGGPSVDIDGGPSVGVDGDAPSGSSGFARGIA